MFCEEITLIGPQGYTYYLWNDSLREQPKFIVNETGMYTLSVANEDGCWSESDSIFIWVHSKRAFI
ncbi:MAG: hypothetical protein K9G58_05515 [Bacteroidales bacterium]|nr:hypothetical protein [Bacteroidales bacterium]MCF8387695.1 hypothetical protein [Bacteroidales bacterium]MCF8397603.1 hypothetical protein [Bacteroidales bacterium]